jgi:hypothetical protein
MTVVALLVRFVFVDVVVVDDMDAKDSYKDDGGFDTESDTLLVTFLEENLDTLDKDIS